MIKKTFIISTWSINELALVESGKKKPGGMWMIYDTYAKKTKETKEDNYGNECTFILQPISRFLLSTRLGLFLGKVTYPISAMK